jgi:hypothetical protein
MSAPTASRFVNPALEALISQVAPSLLFCEVLILRIGEGFELRHHRDAEQPIETLFSVPVSSLYELAQTSPTGSFRPNKTSPNLRSGWRTIAENDLALEEALRHLYPGAVADWFAFRNGSPQATSFRDFIGRQTGIYRVAQLLPDGLAGQTVEACCSADYCLRRRLWEAPGLCADDVSKKSILPCWEPCSLMLEMARRSMKVEQGAKIGITIAEDDLKVVVQALVQASAHLEAGGREGDFANLSNPRRARLVAHKLSPTMEPGDPKDG